MGSVQRGATIPQKVAFLSGQTGDVGWEILFGPGNFIATRDAPAGWAVKKPDATITQIAGSFVPNEIDNILVTVPSNAALGSYTVYVFYALSTNPSNWILYSNSIDTLNVIAPDVVCHGPGSCCIGDCCLA